MWKVTMSFYYLLIFLTTFFVGCCYADKELIFVHALWRHGDRSPAGTFPTDKGNNESTWPQGWGELTTIGVTQQFKLGAYLMKRYQGFLSEMYDAREIYVRSTSYNRTIMSALSNLAGMYPPTGLERWNKNLTWQPIPVHNQPKETDPTLWMDMECPTARKLYEEVLRSPRYLEVNKQNAEFLQFIQNKTGYESFYLNMTWNVADPLTCEYYHGARLRPNDTNHTWPSWVTDDIYNKIVELYKVSSVFYFSTPEIQKFRGGLLWNEIADRMVAKAANKTAPKLKYYAYSAHDTTQIAVLSNLGVYDGAVPVYAELHLFELYKQDDGTYVVEFYKRNGTKDSDLYMFKIPGCGDPCTLNKFAALAETRRPQNWYKECGLPDPNVPSDYTHVNVVVGLLAAISVIFFVLFLFLLVLYIKLRQSVSNDRELLING